MIYILLPAYNEQDNIGSLLDGIAKEGQAWIGPNMVLPVHAVVVNDGSSDKTSEVANAYKGPIEVTVIDHSQNFGLARALETGLQFINRKSHKEDLLITLDADGTHQPRYIFDLIEKLHEGNDVVVASRYAPGGKEIGVNLFRRLLSAGARLAYRLAFPEIPLRDFSCGFRGFRMGPVKNTIRYWDSYLLESSGFACTGELMLKILAQVPMNRVAEIPFELHYEQKGGVSKMPAFKTVLGTLRLLTQARVWLSLNKKK